MYGSKLLQSIFVFTVLCGSVIAKPSVSFDACLADLMSSQTSTFEFGNFEERWIVSPNGCYQIKELSPEEFNHRWLVSFQQPTALTRNEAFVRDSLYRDNGLFISALKPVYLPLSEYEHRVPGARIEAQMGPCTGPGSAMETFLKYLELPGAVPFSKFEEKMALDAKPVSVDEALVKKIEHSFEAFRKSEVCTEMDPEWPKKIEEARSKFESFLDRISALNKELLSAKKREEHAQLMTDRVRLTVGIGTVIYQLLSPDPNPEPYPHRRSSGGAGYAPSDFSVHVGPPSARQGAIPAPGARDYGFILGR